MTGGKRTTPRNFRFLATAILYHKEVDSNKKLLKKYIL